MGDESSEKYKMDNNAICTVVHVGGEIAHFIGLLEAQKYANRKGITRVFVKNGSLMDQYEVYPYIASSVESVWTFVGEESKQRFRVWEDTKAHGFAYIENAKNYTLSLGDGIVWERTYRESSYGSFEKLHEFDWEKNCWNDAHWITREGLEQRSTQRVFKLAFGDSQDPVNPSHYANHKVSPVDLIKEYNLDFSLGNVIKYTARANEKNGKEDLLKALWYLVFSITGDIEYCKKLSKEVKEYGS